VNDSIYDTEWDGIVYQVNVTIQLRRYAGYYTVMFIIPCTLVTMMTFFGGELLVGKPYFFVHRPVHAGPVLAGT
jgi:hypothetical protein